MELAREGFAVRARSALFDPAVRRSHRLLVLALMALVTMLVLVPVGFLFFGALWSEAPRVPGGHLTAGNLATIYATSTFVVPLLTTLAIGAWVGALSVVVGTLLAWLVTRTDLPRAGLWENLLVIPVYLSPLMLALAFTAMAAPRVGFINVVWQQLGGAGSLANVYSFAGIVFVLTVHYAPFAFLYLLGPMRAIGADVEEAATVLGSGSFETIRRILLPMLAPAIFATALMIFTLAAENFAVPTLLGRQSGIRTIPSEIYFWLVYEPVNPNLAASAGTMLLVVTLSGIFVYRRMTRVASRYVTVGGKPHSTRSVKLGWFRPLAPWTLALYLLATIGLPLAALLYGSFLRYISPRLSWSLLTLANYRQMLDADSLLAFRNSLVLGIGAATLTTLLGLIVTYTVHRTRVSGRGLLDYISAMPIAIPGMVLGVGMLWAYVNLPFGIWGTLWVLLIAYMGRFLVHAVRVTGNSLLQISAELDEAAQVLGAGMVRRLGGIIFPLVGRGMLSSWILLFIFVLNEVTATVLLYSSRSITLSVVVWNSLDMYGAMVAFAYSIIQTAITFVLVYFVFRLGGRVAW
ncbi:MAG: iron ABC transporter permease [Candidatus Lambdaproteobacteria bacterium]|nr:iron ABC transporter permease [Candidatus Lambdaproteobacteria bacterium]